MTRSPRFSREQIITTAAELAAADGPRAATMQGVAAAVGAPSGSVYHRFGGRAELLAEVWVGGLERFQREWWAQVEAETDPGQTAGVVVRWARRNRTTATILAAHRADEFVGPSTPEELRRRAAALERLSHQRLGRLARRWLGSTSAAALERVTFAVATVPLAALRRPLLGGGPLSRRLELLVSEAARALVPGPGRGR